MVKRKHDRVHLVVVKAYVNGMYVDSAWTTKEGAEQRIQDLRDSRAAFELTKGVFYALEIRLDVMGVPIVLTVLPQAESEAPAMAGEARGNR